MANVTGINIDLPSIGSGDSNKIISVNNNSSGYELINQPDNSYNSALTDNTTVVGDFGGLSNGTTAATLKTKTLSQIFDLMFFPTQNPTIRQPQIGITLTGSPTGVKLVGSTLNYGVGISFPTNKNRVEKTDGGIEQPYSGDLSLAQYTLLGQNTYNNFSTFSSWNNVTAVTGLSHTVTEGDNGDIDVRVQYNAGSYQPVNSLGENFGSPFSATSTFYTASSSNVEGVYPRFNNNSSGSQDQQGLQSSATNNIVISQAYQETSTIRHGWEFPALIFVGRTWVVQAFNELTNAYQDLDNQSQFTITNTTKTISGNSVNYKKYTNTGSLSGNNNYRLRYT